MLLFLVLRWIGTAGETSGLTGLPDLLADEWFNSVPEASIWITIENCRDI